jgi:hypothetical protein
VTRWTAAERLSYQRNMLSRILFAALAAVSAVSLSAAPTIVSVSPTSGPVAGGTRVVITGTGFSSCLICSPPLPPEVRFGGTPAASVELINENRIEAVTPPHLPATVSVTVEQFDNTRFTLADAFTFVGQPSDAFEAILLPVFSPPVPGAFGSSFQTLVRAINKSNGLPVPLYGVDTRCVRLNPIRLEEDVTLLEAGFPETQLSTVCSAWPARLLYVRRDRRDDISLNLRVRDTSRNASSHGTEIPVVREDEISTRRITLVGVPIEVGFRNTLRIYSNDTTPATVQVTIGDRSETIQLQPGRNIFEPQFAIFTDFPVAGTLPNNATSVRVIIDPTLPGDPVPPFTSRAWAFISVTNNATQEITTISPD